MYYGLLIILNKNTRESNTFILKNVVRLSYNYRCEIFVRLNWARLTAHTRFYTWMLCEADRGDDSCSLEIQNHSDHA